MSPRKAVSPVFTYPYEPASKKRSHRRKSFWERQGRTLLITIVLVAIAGASAYFAGFAMGRRYLTLQVVDPHTGDWKKLDLSNQHLVSLFCGSAAGGIGCAVVRIAPNVAKDAGTGVLLTPAAPDDTPPAGSASPSVPTPQENNGDTKSWLTFVF